MRRNMENERETRAIYWANLNDLSRHGGLARKQSQLCLVADSDIIRQYSM